MARPTLEELEARMAARQAKKSIADPQEALLLEPATPIAASAEEPPAPNEEDELTRLRNEFNALKGRAASSQRETDTLRQQLADQTRSHQALLDAQSEMTKADLQQATRQAAFDALTDEERENFDPELLDVMARMASSAAETRAKALDPRREFDGMMKEREAVSAKTHRDQLLTGGDPVLSQLPTLSSDQKFLTWLEDNPSAEYNLNMLVSAKSKAEVDQLARKASREVQRYLSETNSPAPSGEESAPAQSSLAAGLQRKGNNNLTPDQKEANLQLARQLSRSRNPEDRARAQQLINSN